MWEEGGDQEEEMDDWVLLKKIGPKFGRNT